MTDLGLRQSPQPHGKEIVIDAIAVNVFDDYLVKF